VPNEAEPDAKRGRRRDPVGTPGHIPRRARSRERRESWPRQAALPGSRTPGPEGGSGPGPREGQADDPRRWRWAFDRLRRVYAGAAEQRPMV